MKVSWSTLPPPSSRWMKSSPIRPAASSARSMSSWVISAISGSPDSSGTVSAWFAQVPAKQSACSSSRTVPLSGPVSPGVTCWLMPSRFCTWWPYSWAMT